jgi:hypothetical protein
MNSRPDYLLFSKVRKKNEELILGRSGQNTEK